MRSFKKWMGILLVCCFVLGVNELLSFLLYPYTYTRVDMHHMIDGEYEDLLVGTSHGKCGLDPQVLEKVTGRKTLNVCQGGQYPTDVYYLVKEAARHRKLSRVIYEIDAGYWVTDPNQTADYITFFHEMPWSAVKAEYFFDKIIDADFRTVLFPWYYYRKDIEKIGKRVEQKRSSVYKNYELSPFQSEVQTFREDGFFARHRLPQDRQQEDYPSLWQGPGPKEDAVKAFDQLVSFCEREGIGLVTVVTPVPWVTYEKYQENYEAAKSFFQEHMEERGVPFYCYLHSDREGVPRELEEFADYDGHMYEDAAQRFSKVFGEDLVKY